MAKWGEGDPRWIVEERPDATNVNNWHWTEKNATQWSIDKLKELLLNVTVDNEKIGSCKIHEVSKCEGEATVSNRKAKLIFFYEWELKLNWRGNVNGSADEVEGKVEVLNLSEENESDEIDIEVSTNSTSEQASILKEMMRKDGLKVIRNKLQEYIEALHKEFSVGMILPRKGEGNAEPVRKVNVKKTNPVSDITNSIMSEVKKCNIKGVKLETMKYTCRQTFKCRMEELYNVFTIKEMLQAFTRNEAIIKAEKGGEFKLFNGNVSGKFIDLVPCSKIVMHWRLSSWPKEHYSMVQLKLEEKEDCTELNLTQTGIPKTEIETTKAGWSRYYWESIKATFGFGALLT